MNKVYITNASTTLILEGFKKLNIKLSREELILDIQSDFLEENFFSDEGFNDFFNTDELNTIYMMKRILKNLSNLIKDMNDNKGLINNYISSQNNRFAQRVKAPAYHQVSECQYLKSNFSNIEFPKNINEDIKDKIRLFIKGCDNKNFDEVNKLIKEKFNINEDFKKIDLANSGIKNIDNVEIKTNLFQQISKEFEDMYNLLYSGEEKTINKAVKNILYAYTSRTNIILKNNSINEKDLKKMKNYLETKKNLMKILFDYYREKYNKDLSFDENLLNSIGFTQCRGCFY